LIERVLRWLGQRVAALLSAVSAVVPGGPLGLLVLLAVVVLVVVVVRLRVGKFARDVRGPRLVFEDRSRSAQDYRLAAEQAFAAGDVGAAVRERFRAIMRTLEERGILHELSGRTADEAARDAGVRLPGSRDELAAAAGLFDAVHYGGRPATETDYRRLAALDDQTQRERPGVLT
jgi:type III secretory pathway component EscV